MFLRHCDKAIERKARETEDCDRAKHQRRVQQATRELYEAEDKAAKREQP